MVRSVWSPLAVIWTHASISTSEGEFLGVWFVGLSSWVDLVNTSIKNYGSLPSSCGGELKDDLK